MNKLKTKQQGFTIIEVMIVLVIAAVILLIVFLAVPALQRNSRNNQRRNDVSRMTSSIVEYSNNNNGQLPSDATELGTALQNTGNASYYSYTTVPPATYSPSGAVANDTTEDSIRIVTGAKCDGTDATGGAARRVAILYSVESGSGSTPQCLES